MNNHLLLSGFPKYQKYDMQFITFNNYLNIITIPVIIKVIFSSNIIKVSFLCLIFEHEMSLLCLYKYRTLMDNFSSTTYSIFNIRFPIQLWGIIVTRCPHCCTSNKSQYETSPKHWNRNRNTILCFIFCNCQYFCRFVEFVNKTSALVQISYMI